MSRRTLIGIACIGSLAAVVPPLVPGAGAEVGLRACDGRLPAVLRLALPRSAVPSLDAPAIRAPAEKLFTSLYRRHGRCRALERLQVNLAVGSDYQVLDWLSQGRVDMGIVSDLGLYLLSKRDRSPLSELDRQGNPAAERLLPLEVPALHSVLHDAGRREPRPDPESDLAAFFEQTWCAAAPAAGDPGCGRLRGGPPVRAVVPSHLSAAGFGTLLVRAQRWLEGRLAADPARLAAWRDPFFAQLLAGTRFTFGAAPPAEGSAAAGAEIEVELGAAPAPGSRPRPPVQPGRPEAAAGPLFRDHLVMTTRVANDLFEPGTFHEVFSDLPPDMRGLLGGDYPPAALRPMLAVDPYFGVRTYGFTIPESLALLAQHQEISGQKRLALVLPGGGVKAVYQSKLIDELYGRAFLRNVATSAAGPFAASLPVDLVVGTSGGALIGYFVARLGEGGPHNLAAILWESRPGVPLDSSDIFYWGDLLRYLSAVGAFLVFALLLAVASFQGRRLDRKEELPSHPALRWRLTLTLWPLLAAAPLLVRTVNGDHAKEHIPAIEGLFYMVCACLAIAADQCLVVRPTRRPDEPPLLHPLWLFLPGAALVAWPLSSRLSAASPGDGILSAWTDRGVPFLWAYLTFLVVVVGCGFVLPRFHRRSWPAGAMGRAAVSLAELFAVAVLGIAAVWLPWRVWAFCGHVPFFLLGFGLVVLLIGFAPWSRRHLRLSDVSRRTAYYLSLATATLLVLLLCQPKRLAADGAPLRLRGMELLFHDSSLDLRLGSFMVCLGVLVLVLAALLWIYRSPAYHLEGLGDFRAGFAISLAQIVLVYVVLLSLQALLPNRLSLLELTSGFWLWLLGVSLGVSAVVIVSGAFAVARESSNRLARTLARGLRFLCSDHPNGIFAGRRFVRVGGLGLGAVLWWNFALAPALYGNGNAHDFLMKAVRRFNTDSTLANHEAPRLRTQFLAPANVLERDGTRYFLVQPQALADKVEVPQRPGSGSTWYDLRVRADGRLWLHDQGKDCELPGRDATDQLEPMIFASGSPFPIFPAHLVDLPTCNRDQPVKEPLVDGGYSNNVPVEAAAALAAAQVLIVESTNPGTLQVPPAAPAATEPAAKGPFGGALLHDVHGPLVADLGRLAGFLFERAQQSDRLSRREVFVVSLAPVPRPDWPELFDFRRQTVEKLRRYATQDLSARIGAVESWGPPRFQLSVEVPPTSSGKS
jgi:predicted acylesterase/phospholipase RssA